MRSSHAIEQYQDKKRAVLEELGKLQAELSTSSDELSLITSLPRLTKKFKEFESIADYISGLVTTRNAGELSWEEGFLLGVYLVTEQQKRSMSERARRAVMKKHERMEEKRTEIRSIYATGKFSTKVACAYQEHEAVGLTYSAAVKALRNQPNTSGTP